MLRHVVELRRHILNAVSKVIVRYLTERYIAKLIDVI